MRFIRKDRLSSRVQCNEMHLSSFEYIHTRIHILYRRIYSRAHTNKSRTRSQVTNTHPDACSYVQSSSMHSTKLQLRA